MEKRYRSGGIEGKAVLQWDSEELYLFIPSGKDQRQWDYFTYVFYWVLIRNSLPKAMMVGKQNWTKILTILRCAERIFGRERLSRIHNNYSQILKFLIQIGYRYF